MSQDKWEHCTLQGKSLLPKTLPCLSKSTMKAEDIREPAKDMSLIKDTNEKERRMKVRLTILSSSIVFMPPFASDVCPCVITKEVVPRVFQVVG